jgi:glycosyltransferase involved in cell wall biosynthesis
VPVGDAGALASAMIDLLKDEDERACLSAAASASVRARFSLELMVRETEKVYRSVLA